MTKRYGALAAIVAVGLLLGSFAARVARSADAGTPGLTVFAAASLKNALDAVAAEYAKSSGRKISTSYAASSALARQIEQSAPADVFISADLDWMDDLAGKTLIEASTRVNLLANRLVLIAPADAKVDVKIALGFDLAGALGSGRLALAETASVPAGKYAKAALEKLGAWHAVGPKLAATENVRAALALVARGEAPLGIVYHSDAMAEPKVKVVDTFPEDSHPPIVYPAAVVKGSGNAAAAADFISYLRSSGAQAIFKKEGFTPLE